MSDVIDLATRRIQQIAEDPEAAKDDSALGTMLRIMSSVGRTLLDDGGDAFFRPPGATAIPMPSRQFSDLVAAGAARNRLTIRKALIDDVATNLRGRALLDDSRVRVHMRIAGDDGRIFIHLGGDDVIAITRDGWTIESWQGRTDAPVVFLEPPNYLPLPRPVAGGDVRELRRVLNVGDESFALVCMWLVAALRPDASYPVLSLNGPKGSAKSTATKLLRSLIDPSAVPHRAPPKTEQDLAIAGSRALVLAFDNLSQVSEGLSDWLCRVATGGGSGTRTLHTNRDETTFSIRRPVILNGIPDLAERADLGSRTLQVRLDPPRVRMTDREIQKAFAELAPRVLGALCDAISTALRTVEETPTPEVRMSDAAQWALACETSLGFSVGTFAAALAENAAALEDVARKASPVAEALDLFAADLDAPWSGTASALEAALASNLATSHFTRAKKWPQGAAAIGREVRRVRTDLRVAVISEGTEGRGADRRDVLVISRRGCAG